MRNEAFRACLWFMAPLLLITFYVQFHPVYQRWSKVVTLDEREFLTYEYPTGNIPPSAYTRFCISRTTPFRTLFKGMERASISGYSHYILHHPTLGDCPVSFGPVELNLCLPKDVNYRVIVYDVTRDAATWKTNRIPELGSRFKRVGIKDILELHCQADSSCVTILELAKKVPRDSDLPVILFWGQFTSLPEERDDE